MNTEQARPDDRVGRGISNDKCSLPIKIQYSLFLDQYSKKSPVLSNEAYPVSYIQNLVSRIYSSPIFTFPFCLAITSSAILFGAGL